METAMKTLSIIVSDETEEALRAEAGRTGESIEQLIGRLIDADIRQRATERLLAALDEGLTAADAGDVVALDPNDVVSVVMDRYRRRVAE
jgi:predicted transcriptional regulator